MRAGGPRVLALACAAAFPSAGGSVLGMVKICYFFHLVNHSPTICPIIGMDFKAALEQVAEETGRVLGIANKVGL